MPKIQKSSYDAMTDAYNKAIRMGMADKNYKQKDLAKKMGKNQSKISRMLSDIDEIKFGELRELASSLGLVIEIKGRSNDTN